MAEYPQYVVTLNDTEYTMRLSPEDAERYGDKARRKSAPSRASAAPAESKRAPEPRNK